MWWIDSWPMPWMLIGPIMMVIYVIICMTMMYFMMRNGVVRRHRGHHAVDIVKERYARGEITQTEYEERRRLLEA